MDANQDSIAIDRQQLIGCNKLPIYKIGESGVLVYVGGVEEAGTIVGLYWNGREWKYLFQPCGSVSAPIPVIENQISPF